VDGHQACQLALLHDTPQDGSVDRCRLERVHPQPPRVARAAPLGTPAVTADPATLRLASVARGVAPQEIVPPAKAEGLRLHRPGVSLVEGDEIIALVGTDIDEVQLLAMPSVRQVSDLLMPLLARAMGVVGNVQGAGRVSASDHCGARAAGQAAPSASGRKASASARVRAVAVRRSEKRARRAPSAVGCAPRERVAGMQRERTQQRIRIKKT